MPQNIREIQQTNLIIGVRERKSDVQALRKYCDEGLVDAAERDIEGTGDGDGDGGGILLPQQQ